jgi:hypothetical protein
MSAVERASGKWNTKLPIAFSRSFLDSTRGAATVRNTEVTDTADMDAPGSRFSRSTVCASNDCPLAL